MNALTNTAVNHPDHNAATAGAILAIDLGKYKSVACVHDQATGEFRFTSFETTRAELRKLIGKEQPGVVIIEACLLAGWVYRSVRDDATRDLHARGFRVCQGQRQLPSPPTRMSRRSKRQPARTVKSADAASKPPSQVSFSPWMA